MGKLAETLATAENPRKGPLCGVGELLKNLDDDDRQALQEAIDDPSRTSGFISKALRANDYYVNDYQVARHRRRGNGNGCRCEA